MSAWGPTTELTLHVDAVEQDLRCTLDKGRTGPGTVRTKSTGLKVGAARAAKLGEKPVAEGRGATVELGVFLIGRRARIERAQDQDAAGQRTACLQVGSANASPQTTRHAPYTLVQRTHEMLAHGEHDGFGSVGAGVHELRGCAGDSISGFLIHSISRILPRIRAGIGMSR